MNPSELKHKASLWPLFENSGALIIRGQERMNLRDGEFRQFYGSKAFWTSAESEMINADGPTISSHRDDKYMFALIYSQWETLSGSALRKVNSGRETFLARQQGKHTERKSSVLLKPHSEITARISGLGGRGEKHIFKSCLFLWFFIVFELHGPVFTIRDEHATKHKANVLKKKR